MILDHETRGIAFLFLEFLQEVQTRSPVSITCDISNPQNLKIDEEEFLESADVAFQCLSGAFGIDLNRECDRDAFSLRPHTLRDAVESFKISVQSSASEKDRNTSENFMVAASLTTEKTDGNNRTAERNLLPAVSSTVKVAAVNPTPAVSFQPVGISPLPARKHEKLSADVRTKDAVHGNLSAGPSNSASVRENQGVGEGVGVRKDEMKKVESQELSAEQYEKKKEEFLYGLTQAQYFAGVLEDSTEYQERKENALRLFQQSFQNLSMESLGIVSREKGREGSGRDNVTEEKEKEKERMRCGDVEAEKLTEETNERGRDEDDGKEEMERKREKAEALKAQGNSAIKSKDYSEAISFYSQAIQFDPRNPIYFCNRAAAYQHLGNFCAAYSDSLTATSLDQKYAKAYSRMGLALMEMGRFQEAAEIAFKKALEIEPNNSSFKENFNNARRKVDEQRRQQQQQQQFPGSFFPGNFFPSPVPGPNQTPPSYANQQQFPFHSPHVSSPFPPHNSPCSTHTIPFNTGNHPHNHPINSSNSASNGNTVNLNVNGVETHIPLPSDPNALNHFLQQMLSLQQLQQQQQAFQQQANRTK